MSKTLLDKGSISPLQYATILVCFLMNILDGMDVLVISYCAPSIAKSWEVGPEALGIVFSAGLAGMALGALFLAPFADRLGRKIMILLSAFIMGTGIFLTAYSDNVYQLGFLRLFSGIGIGSMLASTAALTAEYTPDKTKDFWVSLVISGYPVGAVLSGLVAAQIVPNQGWPLMFQIAGLASFITIPFIWFGLSESVDFYLKRQPQQALEKANAILVKMGRPAIERLPPLPEKKVAIPVNDLLSSKYLIPTLQLWLALFLSLLFPLFFDQLDPQISGKRRTFYVPGHLRGYRI